MIKDATLFDLQFMQILNRKCILYSTFLISDSKEWRLSLWNCLILGIFIP